DPPADMAGDPVACLPSVPQRTPAPRAAPPRAKLMQPKREKSQTAKTSDRPTAVFRMKCGSTPSLSHHAESRVSPPAPREPNGAPLSKADRLRQAVSLEGAGEHGLRALDRRRGNARLDQKPGVAVGDRQRIDAALVARAEPALEIGGPLLVGRLGRDHPPRLIERRPPAPDLLDEARPVQDVAD